MSDVPDDIKKAALDVLAERARQKAVEGWTPEHDDEHDNFELSAAAACYAMFHPFEHGNSKPVPSPLWPWSLDWWKPADRRRNLVKAGALILAEIERLDRVEAAKREAREAREAIGSGVLLSGGVGGSKT